MKKPKVTIIILSWNTKKLLKRCLESLQLGAGNCETEVIVVDNGSTDGSKELLQKLASNNSINQFIDLKKNFGFAKGNNQALRQAQGDLIMLLNSDTFVEKEALEKLAVQLIKSEKIGAVSPLLINPDGSSQKEYYMKSPNLWQIFLYHNPALRSLVMKTPLRRLIISEIKKEAPIEVDQLPGAALMAKREVWQKVGFLDEDYQFLYEDVDWCFRAKKLGFKLLVVPEAKIMHLGGGSWKRKIRKNGFDFYQQFFSSLLLFVRKNYPSSQFLLFRLAIVVNFFLTARFRLAWFFLKGKVGQKRLWR